MKIIFAGTPAFAVPTLQALIDSEHEVVAVLTQPDRPAGRGRQLMASPVKVLATEHNIVVLQPQTLKESAAQASVAALNADVMVVAAYGLLLPPVVLSCPKLGCINVHASLLPRWRGASPISAAILAGDETTGVTIMQMDKGLDTGDSWYEIETPISPQDTTASLTERLGTLGAEALLQALAGIESGALVRTPQDDLLATHAPKVKKADAIIDWQQTADTIVRMLRAYVPWPVAHTWLDQALFKVYEAIALPAVTDGSPGMIVAISAEGIDIATGEGLLRVLSCQVAGKRRLPVREFVNALPAWLQVNKRFSVQTHT